MHICELCAQLCNFERIVGRTVLGVADPDLITLQGRGDVGRGRTGLSLFKNSLAETGRADKDLLIGKTVKRTRDDAHKLRYCKLV